MQPEAGYHGDFLDTRNTARSKQVMATLDAINRLMGRDSVFYAASGIKRDWAMAATMKSQHFTTHWQ
jgi:DNA polymerase V